MDKGPPGFLKSSLMLSMATNGHRHRAMEVLDALRARWRRYKAMIHYFLLPYRIWARLLVRPISMDDALLASVIVLDPWTIVKFGHREIISRESIHLSYLARRTTIPLPRVQTVIGYRSGPIKTYNGGYWPGGGYAIIMRRLPGRPLNETWYRMSSEERKATMIDLAQSIKQLERPPVPQGLAVCNCLGRPCLDPSFRFDSFGPYTTPSAFHNFLVGL